MKATARVLAALFALSATAALALKTSDQQTTGVYVSPNIQDVSCPDGAYVQSMSYKTGYSRNTLQLTCQNVISTNGSAPSSTLNLGNCQSCIAAPNGARRLDGGQTTNQGICVYVNYPGEAC